MPRARVTISLDTDSPSDRAVLEFLSGLPRRTRSEIVKEILFDALEAKKEHGESTPIKPDLETAPEGTDPEDIMNNLF